MKKSLVLYCTVLTLVLTAGAAIAGDGDSIKGRVGVTGRIGFLVPSDSEAFAVPNSNLNTDVGFIGGGGFIYGIDKHFAVELDITNTDFDAHRDGFKAGDFNTTNVSIGAQYRFVDIPVQKLVPYLGAGLDILFNDFNFADGGHADVDTVAGVHVSAGADYFLMKQLALTAEMKGVVAPDADINSGGTKIGNYDPTSFSMTFGARYFFN
ncbi:MAG TPA: outer membrane beta-barrel protein [Geobacteraceae bacterium]|nr:outer membrane beta-barrel protein [Geobacteraceae bacterium]